MLNAFGKNEEREEMRNRLFILLSIIFLIMLGACGNKEEANDDTPASTNPDVEQNNPDLDVDTSEEDDSNGSPDDDEEQPAEEGNDDTSGNGLAEGDLLNPYLEEATGGEIEIVYTNTNPGFTHYFHDDVSMTIDAYQIVHVSNMNESAKSSFNDEEEGYVLTIQLTLNNQSGEEVSYASGTSLLADDGAENIFKRSHFVDRDKWLRDDSTEGASAFSNGTFTGLEAFSMTKEQFEKLEVPVLQIDALWWGDDVSNRIGEPGFYYLPMSEAALAKAEEFARQYQDRMVTEKIADKEIFFAQEDMNETQNIEDVEVTLVGVQFANVTPTEGHKERFTNFGDGPLVAITAKFIIKNDSDVAIDAGYIPKRLHIDDRGTMLSQGMLEPRVIGEVEPGETFEGLAVFLFREDEFSIFEEFQLEIGPLSDENSQRLFKEKVVTFDLPYEKSE